jgi:hypothetical protein
LLLTDPLLLTEATQRQKATQLMPAAHKQGRQKTRAKEKDLNFIIIFFDNNLLGLKKLQFDNWKAYINSNIKASAQNVILDKRSNNFTINNTNKNNNIDKFHNNFCLPCLCAAPLPVTQEVTGGISCVAFCLPCLCAAPLPVTQEVTGGISCVAAVKSKGSVPLVSSPSGSAGWAYSPASSKSKGKPKAKVVKMTPKKKNLYLIYGLLLGNSLIMKNKSDLKLIIEIECKYTTFLTEVYNKISSLVDCDNKLTVIKTKLCKGGQLNKVMFLHTYSNNHYLELYNKWYKNKSNKNIPLDIMNYFNEVSLAY